MRTNRAHALMVLGRLDEAARRRTPRRAASQAIARRFGNGAVDAAIQAHVVIVERD